MANNGATTTSSADMKCIIVQQNFAGKRELRVTTTAKPSTPGDGEVLVSVKAW